MELELEWNWNQKGIGTGMELEPEKNWNRTETGTRKELKQDWNWNQKGIETGLKLEPERNWNRIGTGTRKELEQDWNPFFDSQRLHWFSLSSSFGGRKWEGWLRAMERPHSATGDGWRVLVLWVHEQCGYLNSFSAFDHFTVCKNREGRSGRFDHVNDIM